MKHWIFFVVMGIVAGRGFAMSTSSRDCEPDGIRKCVQPTNRDILMFLGYTEQQEDQNYHDLVDYCKNLMYGYNCSRDYVARCVNEAVKDLYYSILESKFGTSVAICTPGTPLNIKYTKYFKCFGGLTDLLQACSSYFKENMKNVQSLSTQNHEQLENTCCTLNEYVRCVRNTLEGHCDADSRNFAEGTLTTVSKPVVVHCEEHNITSSSNCVKWSPTNSHKISDLNDENGARHIFISMGILFLVIFLLLLLSDDL